MVAHADPHVDGEEVDNSSDRERLQEKKNSGRMRWRERLP
jgi:hypothetical protein